jgi:IMP dehydrogenase
MLLTLHVAIPVRENSIDTMQTVEALKLMPVWVNPEHLNSTARIILEGHRLRAIGVVDHGDLVGTVSLDRLNSAEPTAPVATAMDSLGIVIDGRKSVRETAEVFVRESLDYAPAVIDGHFLGIVTANMLLRELGRSWDPLTGLSWSDQLREWGIDNLRTGREVTILFIDLNDFGSYNKRYGHIVGDKVLQSVASMLKSTIEPDRDMLVRYGGDEFAIGTLRHREEADGMAEVLRRRVKEIRVPEADEGVDFCVGVFGGKRTRERESIHYAATLDNLINFASRDCIGQKPPPRMSELVEPIEPPVTVAIEELPPEPAPVPNPVAASTTQLGLVRVVSVFADDQALNSLTQVILSVGENVVSGISSRMGKPVIESVATATVKALERGFPDHPMKVGDIHLSEGPQGQKLVSISGQLTSGDRTVPVGGVETVEQDLYKSVAEATLQAFLSGITLL